MDGPQQVASLEPFLVCFELNSTVCSNGQVFCLSSDGSNSCLPKEIFFQSRGPSGYRTCSPGVSRDGRSLGSARRADNLGCSQWLDGGLNEWCMSLGEELVRIVVIFPWRG